MGMLTIFERSMKHTLKNAPCQAAPIDIEKAECTAFIKLKCKKFTAYTK